MSNHDSEEIFLTEKQILVNYGLSRSTLYRKLKAANVSFGPKGIKLSEVNKAIFGTSSIAAEKLRLTKAQADKTEAEAKQLKGELVPVATVVAQFQQIALATDELIRSFAPAEEYVRRWKEILEAKTGIQQMAEESKLLPADTETHPDPTVRLGWDPKIAYIHDGEVQAYEKRHLAWLAEHRPDLVAGYSERKKTARADHVEFLQGTRNRIFKADGSWEYEANEELDKLIAEYTDEPAQ
jgi:predicted DNA-binding transcriptional regulator AlpA